MTNICWGTPSLISLDFYQLLSDFPWGKPPLWHSQPHGLEGMACFLLLGWALMGFGPSDFGCVAWLKGVCLILLRLLRCMETFIEADGREVLYSVGAPRWYTLTPTVIFVKTGAACPTVKMTHVHSSLNRLWYPWHYALNSYLAFWSLCRTLHFYFAISEDLLYAKLRPTSSSQWLWNLWIVFNILPVLVFYCWITNYHKQHLNKYPCIRNLGTTQLCSLLRVTPGSNEGVSWAMFSSGAWLGQSLLLSSFGLLAEFLSWDRMTEGPSFLLAVD